LTKEAEASATYATGLDLSIIIPTYNERHNILRLLDGVKRNLPPTGSCEILVVDDNSPDGTGSIVENYINSNKGVQEKKSCPVRILHRYDKRGLIPALLAGIENSKGNIILVMDADFSRPPEFIPAILKELKHDPSCVVVASRYAVGGSIKGWSYKRRVASIFAARIARHFLDLGDITDPISGFFAFPRFLTQKIKFETDGYKLLLELIVKSKDEVRIREIPYTFTQRRYGASKVDAGTVRDYLNAVWLLYRYGRKSTKPLVSPVRRTNSQLFLSKAARFFTVGISGLFLNYVVSFVLSNGIVSNLWYMQASVIGIAVSITSNFILNKIWTFEDTDFSLRHTLRQYGLYVCLTSIGALIQLSLIYTLVEYLHLSYGLALFIAVSTASVSNFLTNKKWTFREKIWG
jgi:dolichol-phosphate mannosyltransferase